MKRLSGTLWKPAWIATLMSNADSATPSNPLQAQEPPTAAASAQDQEPEAPLYFRSETVSPQTRQIFERGLEYLARSQKDDGTWTGRLKPGGDPGIDPQAEGATNGETALCLMCFLGSGEDPNYGRYAVQVRKAVRALLIAQNPKSGYIGMNMYEHGFAMLALSEAYGVVDEGLIWGDEKFQDKPTIGHAIELAIGCAMLGQKNNPREAWTYSPDNKSNHEGTRADTSVAGAVLMGLLGARNAEIPVPDEPIDNALTYYQSMTKRGRTAYSDEMQWATPETRSAIAALVFSIGKRTHWEEYKEIPEFLREDLSFHDEQHPYYSRYYMAQSLFQIDYASWEK